jgi:hypothetical protein
MANMDKSALDSYVRGTAAGRQSQKLSAELNVSPSDIEIPDFDMKIDPFYIKIFSVRAHATTVYHGQHGEPMIPACEPGFRAVPDPTMPRGVYKMEPCTKIESYSRPYFVASAQMFTHFNPMTGTTEVLAKDIIRGEKLAESILKAPGFDTDLTEWGAFSTLNDVPTAEEVAEAVAKLNKKYQVLFNEGESLAAQGQLKMITNTQREAAAWLGKPTSWNQVIEMYETCEGCGENVKAQVVVHSCGWVRNWKKAVENGMKTLDQVPAGKRWVDEPVKVAVVDAPRPERPKPSKKQAL